MRYYTDDPVSDAENYIADLDRELEKMPVCAECGEHIQQDKALYIGGNWYCESCIEDNTIYTEDI